MEDSTIDYLIRPLSDESQQIAKKILPLFVGLTTIEANNIVKVIQNFIASNAIIEYNE